MELNLKKRVLIYFFFFFSLIVSLILGENSSGGAKLDFLLTKKYIDALRFDLSNGLYLFIDDNQGHLPFFYIIIANLKNIFGEQLLSYLYLIISSFIPFIFYTILKKKYSVKNSNTLFLLSLVIFLSPYFRSSAVWLTTDNLALFFFLISIKYLLIIETSQETYLKNFYLCFLFLILASYIRQSYALFYILYFLSTYQKLNFIENFYIILFNFFLSIPALIWIIFIFEVETVINGYYWSSNYFFNLLIFTSLFFFYLFPVLLNKNCLKIIFQKVINNKFFFTLLFVCIFFTIILNDIPNLFNGGGVFYKISELTNFNFLALFSFLGVLSMLIFANLNKKNCLIYLTLIFAFPFIYVYQKYYDPLIFVIIFTLLKSDVIKSLVENEKLNNFLVLAYFTIFLFGSYIYYNIYI